MRYFRYAVLSLAALLVLSLGFALVPADPPEPPAPPFTEQARAAALADALELRAAGLQLAGGTADGGAAAGLDRVVTLLTIQARALLLPEAAAASTAPSPATATPTTPAPAPASMTAAGLATALAASGTERLRDAAAADGGMARLLAGAGTAQVLAAQELAAAAGSPDAVAAVGRAVPGGTAPAAPGSFASGTPAACPFAASQQAPAGEQAQPESHAQSGKQAQSGEQVPPSGPAAPGSALAALAAAELGAVYGYQAALARLPEDAAGPASEFLRRHQDLVEDAEAASSLHCTVPPPQEPGYVLESGFLAAPAAGLARLEAGTLPAYGDVVALTDGSARTWAIAGLQAAAERTVHWGGDPGAVPGILLDEARLPLLPE